MHAATLEELSNSFEDEVAPLVVEMEGNTYRLTGNAQAQYEEWQRLIKDLYASETGFETDMNIEVTELKCRLSQSRSNPKSSPRTPRQRLNLNNPTSQRAQQKTKVMWSPRLRPSDGPRNPIVASRHSPADVEVGGWRRRVRVAATATSEIFLLDNARGQRAAGKRLLPEVATAFLNLRTQSMQHCVGLPARPWCVCSIGSTTLRVPGSSWNTCATGICALWPVHRQAAGLPLLVAPVGWLADLHADGFVYGDIKASHFMLRSPTQSCLIDFGTLGPSGATLSAHTPAACPPEGGQRASPELDVVGLVCCFTKCCSRHFRTRVPPPGPAEAHKACWRN